MKISFLNFVKKKDDSKEKDLLESMPEPPVLKNKIGLQKREPMVNSIENQNRMLLNGDINHQIRSQPNQANLNSHTKETQREFQTHQPQMRPMPRAPMDQRERHHQNIPEELRRHTNHPNPAIHENIQRPRMVKDHIENHHNAIEDTNNLIKQTDFEIERKEYQINRERKPAKSFIKNTDYQKLLKEIGSIKNNVSTIESRYNTIINLKDNEDSKLIELSDICEELQKKILFIDKIIFEKNR